MDENFSNLKQGDQVVVCSRRWRTVETVQKVTPKGFLRIGGKLFNSRGSEKTSDPWNHTYLRIATPELLEEIHRNEIIVKANRVMRNAVPTYEQAVKVLEIFNT